MTAELIQIGFAIVGAVFGWWIRHRFVPVNYLPPEVTSALIAMLNKRKEQQQQLTLNALLAEVVPLAKEVSPPAGPSKS
jgi:hypothetical protein